jgi:hypothetical protein
MKFLLLISFVALSFVGSAQSRPATDDPVIRFYPNPATSFVTFDFQSGYDNGYSIQVYSFLGKKVFETKNMGQRTTVNLNDYNRGVYIYQLRDRTGKMVESGKFQVSR